MWERASILLTFPFEGGLNNFVEIGVVRGPAEALA